MTYTKMLFLGDHTRRCMPRHATCWRPGRQRCTEGCSRIKEGRRKEGVEEEGRGEENEERGREGRVKRECRGRCRVIQIYLYNYLLFHAGNCTRWDTSRDRKV